MVFLLTEFGQFLRNSRITKGWTLEYVSKKVGKSVPQLSRIEKGQYAYGEPCKPDEELAIKLLKLYGCLRESDEQLEGE